MKTHQGNSIRKSRARFDIPSRLLGWWLAIGELMSQQSDQGKQAQQSRRRPLDSQVGPLALGLQTQMSTRFLESDFDAPPQDVPFHNLQRFSLLVGGEESGRLEFTQRVTDQEPANRQWREARRVPQVGVTDKLNQTL